MDSEYIFHCVEQPNIKTHFNIKMIGITYINKLPRFFIIFLLTATQEKQIKRPTDIALNAATNCQRRLQMGVDVQGYSEIRIERPVQSSVIATETF